MKATVCLIPYLIDPSDSPKECRLDIYQFSFCHLPPCGQELFYEELREFMQLELAEAGLSGIA